MKNSNKSYYKTNSQDSSLNISKSTVSDEILEIESSIQNSQNRIDKFNDIINDEEFYDALSASLELSDISMESLSKYDQSPVKQNKKDDSFQNSFNDLEEMFINFRVKELEILKRKEIFKKSLITCAKNFMKKNDIVENFQKSYDFSSAKTSKDPDFIYGGGKNLFQKIDAETKQFGSVILELWNKINLVESKIKKSQESYIAFDDILATDNLSKINFNSVLIELQIASLFKDNEKYSLSSKYDINFLLNSNNELSFNVNDFFTKDDDIKPVKFSLFEVEEELRAGESIDKVRQQEIQQGIANLEKINYDITKMENILGSFKRNFNLSALYDFEFKSIVSDSRSSSQPKKTIKLKLSEKLSGKNNDKGRNSFI